MSDFRSPTSVAAVPGLQTEPFRGYKAFEITDLSDTYTRLRLPYLSSARKNLRSLFFIKFADYTGKIRNLYCEEILCFNKLAALGLKTKSDIQNYLPSAAESVENPLQTVTTSRNADKKKKTI